MEEPRNDIDAASFNFIRSGVCLNMGNVLGLLFISEQPRNRYGRHAVLDS